MLFDDVYLQLSTSTDDTDSSTTSTTTSSNGIVKLTLIATIYQRTGSLMHMQLNQFPAVMISFNLNPGYSLEQGQQAIAAVRQQLALPSSITLRY